MNDHCCHWSGSHPSTTDVLLLEQPCVWWPGKQELPGWVFPAGDWREALRFLLMGWNHRVWCKTLMARVFIVEWWGLRPLLTPLPNPHQGKVQRVKIDCEADLPSGQSPPCLYTDLCFSQTVIPKGDRKPMCVREWMRAGRDRASKCQVDAKIIWIRPKDRAAETPTTSQVTMSKRTRSIRKTKIEQTSICQSAFEGGKGTVQSGNKNEREWVIKLLSLRTLECKALFFSSR